MAFYADLSPYSYYSRCARPGTVNVGWLEGESDFQSGSVPAGFLRNLWEFCKVPTCALRGYHTCSLCGDPVFPLAITFEGEKLKLGNAEIRVVGQSGKLYAAPNMVFHYVRDHRYQPPGEFVEAVMCGPSAGSAEYLESMRAKFLLR